MIFGGAAMTGPRGAGGRENLRKKGSTNTNTVESRYNGPAINGNLPITEAILKSLEEFLFFQYWQ